MQHTCGMSTNKLTITNKAFMKRKKRKTEAKRQRATDERQEMMDLDATWICRCTAIFLTFSR